MRHTWRGNHVSFNHNPKWVLGQKIIIWSLASSCAAPHVALLVSSFCNQIIFYGMGGLATCPTPNLEGLGFLSGCPSLNHSIPLFERCQIPAFCRCRKSCNNKLIIRTSVVCLYLCLPACLSVCVSVSQMTGLCSWCGRQHGWMVRVPDLKAIDHRFKFHSDG